MVKFMAVKCLWAQIPSYLPAHPRLTHLSHRQDLCTIKTGEQHTSQPRAPPWLFQHLMGTDKAGIDVLSMKGCVDCNSEPPAGPPEVGAGLQDVKRWHERLRSIV